MTVFLDACGRRVKTGSRAEGAIRRTGSHRQRQHDARRVVDLFPIAGIAARRCFPKRALFRPPIAVVSLLGKWIQGRECMALAGPLVPSQYILPKLSNRAHAN